MTAKRMGDIQHGRRVIDYEVEALVNLSRRLDERFTQAVKLIADCPGRVVVTGMGKAGIIGQKVSATLASTGTPSFYIHPAEAVHGDLGRIVSDDVVLAFSNSGETQELLRLVPSVKRIGAKIVSVTGDAKSTLAKYSDIVLDMGRIDEACPLGLAPSASTTAMLALGDALALTVLNHREFDKERFAFYHPGGDLGRKLLCVEEIMRPINQVATVPLNATVAQAVAAICSGRVHKTGAACVVGRGGMLKGIITDGDLRRRLNEGGDFIGRKVTEVMTVDPIRVEKGMLAADAFKFLRSKRIDELPVVDKRGRLVGIVDVQDMLDTVMI